MVERRLLLEARAATALIKRALPPAWRARLSVGLRRTSPSVAVGSDAAPLVNVPTSPYEALYDAHASQHDDAAAVGNGSFDLIGRLQLSVLLMEGLRPTDTLVDFGCGVGRLALQAIPTLLGGHYIGLDISQTMLARAQRRINDIAPAPHCDVSWIHQPSCTFLVEDSRADMMCAFSVFTHMEHEDTYRYLKAALQVVRPLGRLILSCLPMDLQDAQQVFLQSASIEWNQRWGAVRNVITSRDFMEAIATLAGWKPLRWYAGDEANIRLVGTEEMHVPGQSVLVLERPLGGL